MFDDKLVKFQLTSLNSGIKLVWFCAVSRDPKSWRNVNPCTISLFRREMRLSSLLYCLSCRGAGKSLARSTSQSILFDGENIPFDASLVIYINSTNIPPIIIINRIYETQNLLSL